MTWWRHLLSRRRKKNEEGLVVGHQ